MADEPRATLEDALNHVEQLLTEREMKLLMVDNNRETFPGLAREHDIAQILHRTLFLIYNDPDRFKAWAKTVKIKYPRRRTMFEIMAEPEPSASEETPVEKADDDS